MSIVQNIFKTHWTIFLNNDNHILWRKSLSSQFKIAMVVYNKYSVIIVL